MTAVHPIIANLYLLHDTNITIVHMAVTPDFFSPK